MRSAVIIVAGAVNYLVHLPPRPLAAKKVLRDALFGIELSNALPGEISVTPGARIPFFTFATGPPAARSTEVSKTWQAQAPLGDVLAEVIGQARALGAEVTRLDCAGTGQVRFFGDKALTAGVFAHVEVSARASYGAFGVAEAVIVPPGGWTITLRLAVGDRPRRLGEPRRVAPSHLQPRLSGDCPAELVAILDAHPGPGLTGNDPAQRT